MSSRTVTTNHYLFYSILLLILVLIVPTTAQAKVYAQQLKGTLTVTETSSHSAYGVSTDYQAAARWTLPGRIIAERPLPISPSTARVLTYRNHTTVESGEMGEPDWVNYQFAGFIKEPGVPLGRTNLQIEAKPINPRLKRAQISVMLPGSWGPSVRINRTQGLVPGMSTEVKSLISDPRAGYNAGTGAILGIGAVRTKGSTVSPIEVMSATNILMRYQRGLWRAKGQRLIRAHYWTGEPVTYKVQWNLTSRQPSRMCANIPTRLVRGKTPAQTRRIIRQAGFKPGRVIRTNGNKRVAKGRVFATTADTAIRCGSRVNMMVRR